MRDGSPRASVMAVCARRAGGTAASRLALVGGLAAGLLLSPVPVGAQQGSKVPRVGILPPGPISERLHLWEAFRGGLRELGWVEGQNVTLELPPGEVSPERLPDLATRLVRLRVDVIVAGAMAAVQAARQATSTIPIVMVAVSADPVQAGLVASLARPGGNVTGLVLVSPDLARKRLELLKEVLPGLSRVGVVLNPTNPSSRMQLGETEVAARALGVAVQPLEVREPEDVEKAFQAATRGRTGGLVVLDDALLYTHRREIVRLVAERRLPAVYGFKEFADIGGLMAYAASVADMYRRAAAYVDRTLKGVRVADLPVEQPMRFELVVNLGTARALGIALPPSVLVRADQVLE